jgi:hypothetical protein
MSLTPPPMLSAENKFFKISNIYFAAFSISPGLCCQWGLVTHPSPHRSYAPQSKGRYLCLGPPKYGAGTCPFNQFLMGRCNSYCFHALMQVLMLQFINVQHKYLCLFIYGHYFIWQLLVAVSYQLVYPICIVHSTDCACIQQEVTEDVIWSRDPVCSLIRSWTLLSSWVHLIIQDVTVPQIAATLK